MTRRFGAGLAFAAALMVAAGSAWAHQPAEGMRFEPQRMHDRFERMETMMRNGAGASGEVRRETLREHMDLMHEQMQEMHAMMGGHGGMMMGEGGPGAGRIQERMSGRGMNGDGAPDSRLDAMQERMDYMQQMMEQMLAQQDMMLRDRSE